MNNRATSMLISIGTVAVLLTVCFSFFGPDISRSAVAQTANDDSPIKTLIDLKGKWETSDHHRVDISQSGINLTVDMSSYDRPNAYGSILNDSAIAVIFPDDQSYNGKLVPPDKIKWSDNTTWKKEIK
jgi:hypothetical protein